MLEKTELSVSSLDHSLLSSHFNTQDLVRVKGLERFDLADLISSEVPKEPEGESESYFEEE
jgi:hypothetical protein